jgi:succinyl-diaminopimelate desuccinylase
VASEATDLSNLRQSEALSPPFLVRVLESLVRTKSVNPGMPETAIAAVVSRWLEQTPAVIKVVEFAPERPSVAAVLSGTGAGPTLVLNGHMDTVPIEDETRWTTDPFGAEVRDGYLYGRGACDMKAGLAIQIAVAHHLASMKSPALQGSLVLHFAAGEERAEPGTLSLLDAGFGGDFGITTEPTSLRVATATRGTAYYSIRLRGRSIHASRADLGLNPIWPLRGVLDVLRSHDEEVRKLRHPLLPGGTCTPTVVRAGIKENVVPDQCEISVDRRLLPGEDAAEDERVLRSRLAQLKSEDPTLDVELTRLFTVEPAEIDPASPFVRQVLEAVTDVTGETEDVWGAPFGSDVRNLVNDAGIEAVTFGPGDTAECHCADERVSVRQTVDAALTIATVATRLLCHGDAA